jgi:hypothetical protein
MPRLISSPASNGGDAFVTKLSAAGDVLAYSSYLGGSGIEYGWGVAVDMRGKGYVVGDTTSADFPIAGAAQPLYAGGGDAFISRVGRAGRQPPGP